MGDYIVVLGDINADITAFTKRLPKIGESVTGKEVNTYPGGKGANQADQCAKLGVKTYMIGRTGSDFQGITVLKSMRDDGIDCSYVKVAEDEKTGCAVINIDENGKNTLVYTPAANMGFTKEDIDKVKDLIVNAGVFISQNAINQDVIVYALKIAHEAGVTTIFNPAPASELPQKIYEYVDFITPNETESELFTGILMKDHTPEEWRAQTKQWFFDQGVKRICITMGSDGVFYADKEEEMVIPAFKIDPIDTTAAGDSFHGGLAYGLINDYPLDIALRIGCACGGMTSMGKGAQSSIQRIEKVKQFMEKNGVLI